MADVKDTAAKSTMRRIGCNLRKPLRDVSNRKKSASNKSDLKLKQVGDDDDDDYSLDRLLLVQSDISNLLHQIDGLVVQAFKLESMRDSEKFQIKSFAQFLSGTLESLKPWVPRFEKVIAAGYKSSSDSRCQEMKCNPAEADDEDEDEIEVNKSPEVMKTNSLVSPSPLVSWRDNCTVQRGKKLFLLTPLPKTAARSFTSKQQNAVKSSFDKFSSTVQGIPRFGLTEITSGGLPKCDTMRTPGCKLVSTPKLSFRDCSMLVMTPGVKLSPPRSCVLLEPDLESSRPGTNKPHKATPYPAQLQHSGAPEMNSGINVETDNKEADASLSWLTSPPKTCVLMEPSDIKDQKNLLTTAMLPSNIAEADQVSKLIPTQSKDFELNYTVKKSSFQEIFSGTPMWKKLESAVQRSGRRPGENTLKKELWTKFEAASFNNDFSFYASPLEIDSSHKGFLDRLEEVSGEVQHEEYNRWTTDPSALIKYDY